MLGWLPLPNWDAGELVRITSAVGAAACLVGTHSFFPNRAIFVDAAQLGRRELPSSPGFKRKEKEGARRGNFLGKSSTSSSSSLHFSSSLHPTMTQTNGVQKAVPSALPLVQKLSGDHDLVLKTFRLLIADLCQQFSGGHPG